MKKICILISLLLFSGWGGPRQETHPPQLITQIRVAGTAEGQPFEKSFSAPEKLDAIVLLLRQLEPGKPVEITPETFRADGFELTGLCNDGSRTVYRQILHHYLQVDAALFRPIRETPAARLLQLVQELPGDPVPVG